MRVESKNLTYIYSENSKDLSSRALDDVTLTVEEGEFFGIIGHTGSGKTTFVQHLNGLIRLGKDKGLLKVGEFDLADKKCDLKKLRSKVGMVFQYPEYQLFAETVREDVAFGIRNFTPEKTEEQIEEMVREAVETVGLDYDLIQAKSPFELSGGQKRRVAIAGVIVTKPEVLVLDEPVAGLDPVGKQDFIRLLKKLHQSFVKTIIIVSHDMNLVAENCTRVAVFSGGKIVDEGVPEKVFSNYEKVEQLGLDLPVTAYLSSELEKVGLKVNSDLTVADFIDKVATSLTGGGR